MPRPPYSDEAIEAKKRDSRERFQAELSLRPKNIKNIEDLKTTFYPTSVDPPDLELSFSVEPGRFRYHRSFLLQFKGVCKEKPASLPPLDAFGLDPAKTGAAYAGGERRDKRRVGSLGMGNAPPLQRQAAIGLGLGTGVANRSGFAMGNFQSPSNSQSRFEASNAPRAGGIPFAGGGAARNQRGNNRNDNKHNIPEPDDWNVAGGVGGTRQSTRAGDLSQFGKISKPTGIRFGPSSVFSKKDTTNRDSSVGRAGVANMFSALSMGTIGTADGPPPPVERTMSSHRPSAGLEPGGSSTPTGTGERRALRLLPKAKPTEAKANKAEEKEEEKEEERKDAVLGTMTGEV